MLSSEHKEIIRATVPLLEQHGERLARHFYQKMLTEHPEVKAFFNQTHQASGQQAKALANSVLMYARNIDQLEALGPLVSRIVNKHVALQVQPKHYPIVGNYLLQSIREVLGKDVATDEVLTAWEAAYLQLADLLIGAEEQAYQHNAEVEGGWRGERAFFIAEAWNESDTIRTLVLAPIDGGPVLRYRAGQYIGLHLMIDGNEVRRNYSLSASTDGRTLQLSVKHIQGGLASTYLHACQPGDILQVFPPAGEFTLDKGTRPIVFLTAGVGITPAMPLLDEALSSGRTVHFIHATQNGRSLAFHEALDVRARQHADQMSLKFCFSRPLPEDTPDATGHLTASYLQTWCPELSNAEVYLLGPVSFMADMKVALLSLDLPDTQLHYECFGPHTSL